MKLDFQIIHLLHPHYVTGHGCVYDHIRWTVWFSNSELLNEINKKFNYNLTLEEEIVVKEDVAHSIWHYIQKNKKWIGTFGDDYDCSILDIYNQ